MLKSMPSHRYSKYSITYSYAVTAKDRFRVNMGVPVEPETVIKMYPALSSVEFLLYVLSVISTWFGISVISVNPLKLIARITHSSQSNITRKEMKNVIIRLQKLETTKSKR